MENQALKAKILHLCPKTEQVAEVGDRAQDMVHMVLFPAKTNRTLREVLLSASGRKLRCNVHERPPHCG